MQMRRLGELWPVSSLTIGGGGLGQLWGTTSRDQAVATMREAIDAGINLLDVAPRYGDAEAERVVGDAFGAQLPESVGVGAFARAFDDRSHGRDSWTPDESERGRSCRSRLAPNGNPSCSLALVMLTNTRPRAA